jgi:hypothetical protein
MRKRGTNSCGGTDSFNINSWGQYRWLQLGLAGRQRWPALCTGKIEVYDPFIITIKLAKKTLKFHSQPNQMSLSLSSTHQKMKWDRHNRPTALRPSNRGDFISKSGLEYLNFLSQKFPN